VLYHPKVWKTKCLLVHLARGSWFSGHALRGGKKIFLTMWGIKRLSILCKFQKYKLNFVTNCIQKSYSRIKIFVLHRGPPEQLNLYWPRNSKMTVEDSLFFIPCLPGCQCRNALLWQKIFCFKKVNMDIQKTSSSTLISKSGSLPM
jgi:hypothetical protein